jgi:hypothetical protein
MTTLKYTPRPRWRQTADMEAAVAEGEAQR